MCIRDRAKALLDLLNDILDFSKIEAGRMDVESVPMQVSALLRGVADLFEARLAEKDIALHIDISPEVPAVVLGLSLIHI